MVFLGVIFQVIIRHAQSYFREILPVLIDATRQSISGVYGDVTGRIFDDAHGHLGEGIIGVIGVGTGDLVALRFPYDVVNAVCHILDTQARRAIILLTPRHIRPLNPGDINRIINGILFCGDT